MHHRLVGIGGIQCRLEDAANHTLPIGRDCLDIQMYVHRVIIGLFSLFGTVCMLQLSAML